MLTRKLEICCFQSNLKSSKTDTLEEQSLLANKNDFSDNDSSRQSFEPLVNYAHSKVSKLLCLLF